MKLMKRPKEIITPQVVTPTEEPDTRELLDMGKVSFKMILDKSHNIQSLCEDFTVRNVTDERLRLNELAGITYITESGEVRRPSISRHAMGQLCNKVGVPHEYMKKCISSGRIELAQDNMNSWLSDFNKDLFIREYDGKIRGVLTPRYSVCDTPTILQSMQDSFPVDDYSIKGFFLNEERLHMRLVSPTRLPVDNEDLYPGFSIDSSDVGRSNLTVNFFIWKKVCTNGLIVPKKFGVLFHQVHRGITTEAFQSNLQEALDLVEPIVAKVVESIKNTATVSLEDAFKDEDSLKELIESIKNSTNMSDESTGKVIQLMQDGTYNRNRWGLINSITQVAQDFTLERRIELERIAGGMLLVA